MIRPLSLNAAHRWLRALFIASLGALPFAASAATATLRPSKDTTIYGDADLSNGGGSFLFAGSSGPNGGGRALRSLIAFDLAGQVPAGATINSVTLTLGITTPIAGNSTTLQLTRPLPASCEGTAVGTRGQRRAAPATTPTATSNARFFNTSSS